jgi:hypothetical protein
VDGKKRQEGKPLAKLVRVFPGLQHPILTYSDYVALYMNLEWGRIANIIDQSLAFSIGTGKEKIPDSWIDLMCDDDKERARWKLREFKED